MADKPLQAGDLDRKIKLFRKSTLPVPTRDEYGQVVAVDNDPYVELYAKYEANKGSESDSSDKQTAQQTDLFTVRFRDDVLATDRLEFEGKVYDVLNAKERAGARRQWLDITARKHN